MRIDHRFGAIGSARLSYCGRGIVSYFVS